MSSSASVYLGPYLFVPRHATSVTTPLHICSAQCGAKVSIRDRFCGSCGAPVEVKNETTNVMEPIYPADLTGDLSERFWTPESGIFKNGTFWLPNFRGSGLNIQPGDAATDLSDDFVVKSKERALVDFASVIAELKSLFGLDVELRFGVVPYYN